MFCNFSGNYNNWYRTGIFFTSLALIFCACQPAAQEKPLTAPASAAAPSSLPAEPTSTPQPGMSGGLTFEEMRSTTPPSPVDFRLAAQADGIRLDWVPAPPVDVPHAYSDTILHYNVYRRLEGETDLVLLTTVTELYFVDKNVSPGTTYHYAVSAVYEGPLEGERTEELSCSTP